MILRRKPIIFLLYFILHAKRNSCAVSSDSDDDKLKEALILVGILKTGV